MKLIIGGTAQGKLRFAMEQIAPEDAIIWDGALPGEADVPAEDINGDGKKGKKILIVDHFHLWVKRRLSGGGNPEEEIEGFLARFPDCVIISDEIGNGIVPLLEEEREYRERTGRILIRLAKEAEEVDRVLCGIGQRIK